MKTNVKATQQNASNEYGKCPIVLNTLFHTSLAQILFFMQLFHIILSEMDNSVDPDQTAPWEAVWSGSILFAYAILSDTLMCKILGHLQYNKICFHGDVRNILSIWLKKGILSGAMFIKYALP